MAEEKKRDPADVDVIVALNRLRPDANAQVKQQFAKAFAQALDVASVAPGEQFFLVTGVLWEDLKAQRDKALEEAQKASDDLVNKQDEAGQMLKEAEDLKALVHDLLDDFERGIIDKDEIRDKLGLPVLGIS